MAEVSRRLPEPPNTRSSAMLTPVDEVMPRSCLMTSAQDVLVAETAYGQSEQDDRVRRRQRHALDHAGPDELWLQRVRPGEGPVRGQELPPVPEGGDRVDDVAEAHQAASAATTSSETSV